MLSLLPPSQTLVRRGPAIGELLLLEDAGKDEWLVAGETELHLSLIQIIPAQTVLGTVITRITTLYRCVEGLGAGLGLVSSATHQSSFL